MNNLLKLYKHLLFFCGLAKAGILKIPGIKYKANGINKDNNRLEPESLIRWICVLTYIPQKQVI